MRREFSLTQTHTKRKVEEQRKIVKNINHDNVDF